MKLHNQEMNAKKICKVLFKAEFPGETAVEIHVRTRQQCTVVLLQGPPEC